MTEKRERNHSLGRQSPVQKSYESVGDGWAPDGHARKKKKRTGRCCDTRHTSYQVHTYLVMSLLSFESRGTSRENQAKETRKRKVQSKKQQGREKKNRTGKKKADGVWRGCCRSFSSTGACRTTRFGQAVAVHAPPPSGQATRELLSLSLSSRLSMRTPPYFLFLLPESWSCSSFAFLPGRHSPDLGCFPDFILDSF